MRYKIAACDIDDTLLRRDLTVSQSTKDTILNFQARGGVFVLSTGRMYPSARALAEELGLNGYLVSYQGAVVSELATGRILADEGMDASEAVVLLRELEKSGGRIQIYDRERLYVRERTRETVEYERMCGVKAEELHESLADYTERTGKRLTKILVIDTPEATRARNGRMKEKFGENFYFCISKPYFLEILKKGVSKAVGIERVAAEYGLTMADVMAVGDGDNDIPMIRAAALGVAVANASTELKAEADLIAPSNEEDAVALLLRLNLQDRL